MWMKLCNAIIESFHSSCYLVTLLSNFFWSLVDIMTSVKRTFFGSPALFLWWPSCLLAISCCLHLINYPSFFWSEIFSQQTIKFVVESSIRKYMKQIIWFWVIKTRKRPSRWLRWFWCIRVNRGQFTIRTIYDENHMQNSARATKLRVCCAWILIVSLCQHFNMGTHFFMGILNNLQWILCNS